MSVVFYGCYGFLSNKTDRHDIAEILLKVALYTMYYKPNPILPSWELTIALTF